MNRAQLVDVLAIHFGDDKVEAARALDAVVQTITYCTAMGERVTITGFGTFEKTLRPARTVRDARTGERRRVKASAIPQFRAGAELKDYTSGVKKVPRAARLKVTTKLKPRTPAARASRVAETESDEEKGWEPVK